MSQSPIEGFRRESFGEHDESSTPHESHPPSPPPERRQFLRWLTVGLGGLFGVLLGVPAIAYLLDPRNRKGQASSFKTVANRRSLEKGKPTEVVIRDLRRDAWTLHPSDLIGRVWLIRQENDDPDKDGEFHVDAFTTICPHLGCSINYEANKNLFICPCHNGTFAGPGYKGNEKVGQRVELETTNPAPRGMDSLECRPDPDNKDLIQIKYENFRQGEHDKVAKG